MRLILLSIIAIGLSGCSILDLALNSKERSETQFVSMGAQVEGRTLMVDGQPYFIEGVCWNPVPKGKSHPEVTFANPDQYRESISTDIRLMKEAGINTIRSFVPIEEFEVLDQIHQAGIKVIVPFYGYTDIEKVKRIVAKLKDHPAILMYEIGSSWNENSLYSNPKLDFVDTKNHIRAVAREIKAIDNSRPVSSAFAKVPDSGTIAEMVEIDVWGINYHEGKSFGNMFQQIRDRIGKPVYFSEFGADNFNTNNPYANTSFGEANGVYDEMSAAEAVGALISEIQENNAYEDNGVVIGGTVFEWNDEWWKANEGSRSVQETVHSGSLGVGPYPDNAKNEEWWGVVDIDRNTRAAYDIMKNAYISFAIEVDAPPVDESSVRISGRQLLVGGEAYFIEGVCWNPVPKGEYHPNTSFRDAARYQSMLNTDIRLMKEAGINTVRPYVPITDLSVLDQLYQSGIRVIVPFYGYASIDSVRDTVNAVKDHPAILMYEIGNEWNYNALYSNPRLSGNQVKGHIRAVAREIKSIDNSHPVGTSYGEIPDSGTVAELSEIDIWGVNVYSGLSFGNRFDVIRARFNKPVYFSEFGADNFNTNNPNANLAAGQSNGFYDPEASARALDSLIGELQDNHAYQQNGAVVGGTVFEWNDEWWKTNGGSSSVQDTRHTGEPGFGPYPDSTFNEEWWGIVDIDRNTRPGYEAVKKRYLAFSVAPEDDKPSVPTPEPMPEPESAEMTLMQWNVHYQNADFNGLANVISGIKPDIFGLNEFTKNPGDLLAQLNNRGKTYQVQTLGSSGFIGYGTTIFYDAARFSEIEGNSVSVQCPGTRGGPRAANYVLLEDQQSGQRLITGGIHLSSCPGGCDDTHRCELRQLYDRFSELKNGNDAPVIWMGDLNRSTADRIFQEVISGQFTQNGFQSDDLSRSQRETWYQGGIIDYIIGERGRWERIAGGSTCQGTINQKLFGADHFPVYTRVKIRDTRSNPNLGSLQATCPR